MSVMLNEGDIAHVLNGTAQDVLAMDNPEIDAYFQDRGIDPVPLVGFIKSGCETIAEMTGASVRDLTTTMLMGIIDGMALADEVTKRKAEEDDDD